MKKLFNKALMYQNYYTGKLVLFIGCFLFALISYFCINSELSITSRNISNFDGNRISYVNFIVLLVSWCILTGVYFCINGIKKNNVMSFLQSGPFSKEQIKINQVLTLFISLMIISFVYVYIFFCITYKRQELVSLIPGYYDVFIRDILRIILCGVAFISYLVFMDTVFSNIVLVIIMSIISPFIFLFTMYFTSNIFFFVNNDSMYNIKIIDYISNGINSLFKYIMLYESRTGVPYELSTKMIMITIAILSILLFVVSWYLNKNFKMNNVNKLFNFRFSQVLFEYIMALELVLIFINMALGVYANKYMSHKFNNSLFLIIILVGALVLSWFISKLLDKYIKKYS